MQVEIRDQLSKCNSWIGYAISSSSIATKSESQNDNSSDSSRQIGSVLGASCSSFGAHLRNHFDLPSSRWSYRKCEVCSILVQKLGGGQSVSENLKKVNRVPEAIKHHCKEGIGLLGEDRDLAKYRNRNQGTKTLPFQNLVKFRKAVRKAPTFRFNDRKTTIIQYQIFKACTKIISQRNLSKKNMQFTKLYKLDIFIIEKFSNS